MSEIEAVFKLYPIVCYTCGRDICKYKKKYEQDLKLNPNLDLEDYLNKLGIIYICCRKNFISPCNKFHILEEKDVIDGKVAPDGTPYLSNIKPQISKKLNIDKKELKNEQNNSKKNTEEELPDIDESDLELFEEDEQEKKEKNSEYVPYIDQYGIPSYDHRLLKNPLDLPQINVGSLSSNNLSIYSAKISPCTFSCI